VRNFISKDVNVLLRKAYIAEGLFELRGFDFSSYDPNTSCRLISYQKKDTSKLCVLNSNNQVQYWVEDYQLLKYLSLLENSIKADPNLKMALNLCIQGQAKPLKLFFNKQLEIDYSKAPFPKIYCDIFKTSQITPNQRNLVKPSLNYLQTGISFNYSPRSAGTEDGLMTHISIMHDLRAIESLRKNLPQVYAEVSKRALVSEAGRFYLLDSLNGCDNDE
jgi:hypothetical protein